MTKIYINGIIDRLYIFVSKEMKENISMEENAGNFNTNKPHCKQTTACSNNKKSMNEMNINLTQATNYLIQLFYRTNQKYSCTRTKLGKLLSIVAFKYAREGKLAFDETIYKYEKCGTAIKEIMQRFKDSEIYTPCDYNDDTKAVSQKMNIKVEIPSDFSNIEDLSDTVKETIDSVFLSFGAFSPADLGECINPIVNLSGITTEDNKIDISKIEHISLDVFAIEQVNPLLKFLFN